MAIGNRIGKLNGLPVYKVSVNDWNLYGTQEDECFYWVANQLFYHDIHVGKVYDGGTVDLDEDKFNNVRRAWEDNDPVHANLPIPVPTRVEEARPVEEPKPDNDPAEPDRPHDELVGAMLGRGAWTIKDMLKGCNMAADAFLETVKEA